MISTDAKAFLKDGYRVLGLHQGFKGLFSEEPEIKEIDFALADTIFSRGGSTLIMSRFKPGTEKLNTKLFLENNVKLLVRGCVFRICIIWMKVITRLQRSI
jgi:6-phosphofructokinase 1